VFCRLWLVFLYIVFSVIVRFMASYYSFGISIIYFY